MTERVAQDLLGLLSDREIRILDRFPADQNRARQFRGSDLVFGGVEPERGNDAEFGYPFGVIDVELRE